MLLCDVCQAITAHGGRFLEAPVMGSREAARDGSLVVLAAGDKSLYDDSFSCFSAIGKKSYFLGMLGSLPRPRHALICLLVCALGLVLMCSVDVFYGIEQKANSRGYGIISCISDESLQKERQTLDLLSSSRKKLG